MNAAKIFADKTDDFTKKSIKRCFILFARVEIGVKTIERSHSVAADQ